MTPASLDSLFLDFIRILLEPAVRSLGLAGLVILVLVLFKVKGPALRLSIWTAVLFAALAMPFLCRLLPTVSVPVKIVPGQQHVLTTAGPKLDLSVEQTASRQADNISGHKTPMAQPPASTRLFFSWPTIGIAVYLLVTGFFLARISLGFLLSRKLRRTAQSITDPHALGILTTWSEARQLTRVPVLCESKAVIVPVTLGIIHPFILLPEGWHKWEETKLRAVMVHELSHVAGWDYLRQILAALHHSLFWFSPLSWWLNKHLADLAEQVGDDTALLAVPDRTYYAEVLLGFFMALKNIQGRVRFHGISMARCTTASRRMERILTTQAVLSPTLKRSAVLVLIFSIIPLVYLMAAVQPSDHQESSLNTNAPQTAQLTGKTDVVVQDSQAMKLEEGKKILEKWITARGGRNRLAQIRDIKSSYSMKFPSGLNMTVTRYKKGPDKLREDTEINGRTFTNAVNGQTGWRTNPTTGETEDMPGEALLQQAWDHEALISPEEFGHVVTFEGRKLIMGKEYLVLNQAVENQVVTHYIDPDTFLRYMYSWVSSGTVFETYEFDYQDIEGTKVPFGTETRQDGEHAWRMIAIEYKYNSNLEDSLFERK